MSQHHTGGSRWIVLSRLSNISVHAASGVTACACCHPGGDGGGGGGGGGEYEVEDASSVATATSAGWREGRTMEAKRLPGLFAIGEAVDVTGWLGGYNFQWAWSSGWAAAQALSSRA